MDVSGTATFGAVTAAVANSVSQATRANLVTQYNQIISQITTTAQDASFNGINLLNGDSLKLVFNETGKSTSTINGVTFNPAGLGLAALTSGTDFIDNAGTNTILTKLNNASTTLRSQASAFGANLSIVQIRQDFNKSLINVLQTGSSALTLADTKRKRPTARRCRPASRLRRRRCRSPTSRSRACFSCCADTGKTSANENGGAMAPPFFFLTRQISFPSSVDLSSIRMVFTPHSKHENFSLNTKPAGTKASSRGGFSSR